MKMHMQSKRFQIDIRFGKLPPATPSQNNTTHLGANLALAPKIYTNRQRKQMFGFTPTEESA